MKKRCEWCSDNPLYLAYHDEEWGVPVIDDRLLFEVLVLEGAQAGLSWLTILKKRQNYRLTFDNFDCDLIASYAERDITRLIAEAGIVRNRRKIESAVKNARGVIDLRQQYGSFSTYLWNWVDGFPLQNN